MTKAIRTALFLGVTALVVGGPCWVYAQTPAQMEYERQQREYRQAEERRQQEQQRLQQLQQENARRQQEEFNRSIRETTPDPQSPQYPSPQESSPSGSRDAEGGQAPAQNMCKAKPVRAGEHNPLIGQWRYLAPQAGSGDLLSEVLALGAAMSCPAFATGFAFREKSIIARGKEIPANYGRDGDVWWLCAADVSLGFRVANPNRLHMVDPSCAFERAGGNPSVIY